MEAYEQFTDEQIREILTDFKRWSGGHGPVENIWESNDPDDEDVPQVIHYVGFWCSEKNPEEPITAKGRMIYDLCHDEVSAEFLVRARRIEKEIEAGWQSPGR